MPNYGDPKYWEERYKCQQGTTFDWLEDYSTLRPIVNDLKLDFQAKIINLGCGNAEFCEKMFDEGYHDIVNIDISENVIKQMQQRNSQREGMTCK
jgi:2-polyprenyl-3-methyl-5-hydroxy-6-metoxy-1,4-benzoquinol methylase